MVLGALSCFGIILLKRRGLVALIVAVRVVCLCLLIPFFLIAVCLYLYKKNLQYLKNEIQFDLNFCFTFKHRFLNSAKVHKLLLKKL